MKVEFCDSYEAISVWAKNIVENELRKNPSLLLCAATGGSPTRMYELLKEDYATDQDLFSRLRVIKLDEWGGISMGHPGTCEQYLQQHVIQPMCITSDRYISFESNPEKPECECERIHQLLKKEGPTDLCILGIGMNGHIALNEPSSHLHPDCHVALLSEKSLQHPMIAEEVEKPSYGLTLGMADILQSKMIILLINGLKKKEITRSLLSGQITTALPASFLWLHPNVICLIDKDTAPDNY